MAAAEFAELRLNDFPSTNHKGIEIDHRNRVFCLLDKNGDGRISIEELMEVMEELGAPGEDACEMMQLLDSNSDGSLSSDEFDLFQKQVNADICYFSSKHEAYITRNPNTPPPPKKKKILILLSLLILITLHLDAC